MMPKVSVITINYNNAEGLQRTIQSVLCQTYTQYEYIIIDGGSNDRSAEVLNQYRDKITHIVSEKDEGIYDAMNKGIRLAAGEYLLFINSGDEIYNKSVLENVFCETVTADILYGNMQIMWSNGETSVGKMPPLITRQHMLEDTLWHPVSFIKKELFTKYGLYRTDLKIAGDYDFFTRMILDKKVTLKYSDTIIATFYHDGISSRPENQELVNKERTLVQMEYFTMDEIESNKIKLQQKQQHNRTTIRSVIKNLIHKITH